MSRKPRHYASEHAEQVTLFRMAKYHAKRWPELDLMFAIPNGGDRHPAVAGKLKAEGVKAGVPDIFLPVPRGGWSGLFIELKTRGGRATQTQREWLDALHLQGYLSVICKGADEAWSVMQRYLTSEKVDAR